MENSVEMKTTQKIILAALASSGIAFAQTPAPAAPAKVEPDYTLAFNVGVVTDYRFRGISQTRRKPALQGGADFSLKNGLYIGTWLSTINILRDIPGGRGDVEWDIYGGYKGAINDDFSYDVGLLRYQYPRQNFNPTVNTTELYGAVTWKVLTVKYSHSLEGQTFGVANSRGTGYLEAAATFDLGNGYSITPHIGRQRYRGTGNGIASYTDLALGVNKDFGNGFSVSATALGTNANSAFYTSAPTAGNKNLGRGTVVVGAKYTF